jgi:hypothetical protein
MKPLRQRIGKLYEQRGAGIPDDYSRPDEVPTTIMFGRAAKTVTSSAPTSANFIAQLPFDDTLRVIGVGGPTNLRVDRSTLRTVQKPGTPRAGTDQADDSATLAHLRE